MTWRDHLLIHSAADLFPPTSADELRELGDDIARHGIRTPIIIWSNSDDDEPCEKLLDGRNRLDAAEQAGLLSVDGGELRIKHPSGDYVPIPKSYSCDDDPYELVLSYNIQRRHLTPENRREVIAKLLTVRPELSNRQIAKQVKAHQRTVATVCTELEVTAATAAVKKTVGADGIYRPAHGRKQPTKAKSKSKSVQLAEAVIGKSERCLNEFKHACDHWLPKLNADDLKAARQHFNDVCGKHERADGARASPEQPGAAA